MIVIIDYDTGNIQNVINALNHLGIENQLSADPQTILNADGIILPGVGAFPDAMKTLNDRNLVEIIQQAADKNIPILGICLGMQLLFDTGEEFEQTKGLGLIPGKVVPIPITNNQIKVPQVGWNINQINQKSDALGKIIDQNYSYFVHSYYAKTSPEYIVSTTDYGISIPSIVRYKNILGMQFHPEKSAQVGQNLLLKFKEGIDNGSYSRN